MVNQEKTLNGCSFLNSNGISHTNTKHFHNSHELPLGHYIQIGSGTHTVGYTKAVKVSF